MCNPCKTCGCTERDASGHCKDCKRAKNKQWRAQNHAKALEASARWKANNPELVKATEQKWLEQNRDRRNESVADWHRRNPEAAKIKEHRRRAAKKASGGSISKGLVDRLLELQRGLCPCCRSPLGDDFHMDHIVPLSKGGANADENIQLLRAECNLKKRAKHPVEFMQERGFLL